jgi:pilus assembly protein CpaB
MKTAQIAVLGIALVAGGGAAYLMSQPATVPSAPVVVVPTVDSVKVLVAAGDINVGTALSANDLKWQEWPVATAGSAAYITESTSPGGIQEWTGAIVRIPFVAGEPIRAQKLIKAGGSGFLSAILPAGMRAVTVNITADTAAGGFILPNDRVDVIMARRDPETTKQTGADSWSSETILRDIRILAIDQSVQETEGVKANAKAATATLELSPKQAETIAVAKAMGTLSLALRSLADAAPKAGEVGGVLTTRGTTAAEILNGTGEQSGLAVVRYGTGAPVAVSPTAQ